MPIRSQLVILVLAVIAPVAVLAAMATVGLWELQRDAYQQRFLERVSALRIALDTEIDSTLRQLRGASDASDTRKESAEVTFRTQAERLLANNPAWSMVGLLGADGTVLTRIDRRPALAAVRFDLALFAEIAAMPRGVISNLVDITGEPGAYLTYIALPITRDGVFRGVVYIGIEASAWLEFFKRYPIHERATLTLNDRDGRIIARTLHNEKWAGQRSTDQYLASTIGRDEGTMRVVGVDGEPYYSAFSRSRTAGWLVGTGVPRDHVEADLSRPTLLILFSVFAAAGMATLFAYILGGRITRALTALADSVESVAAGERRLPMEPLPIEEAETVRRALIAGSRLLAARETSLNGALAREAKSRAAAELASRAKDDLLAMLGHELRNPLNAIKAAVSLLEMPEVKPDVADRARAVVQRQIGHLTSIIDDLLDVARLDSGKAQLKNQRLDLAAVTRHVVEAFTSTGRCRSLQMQVDLSEAWVVGDETRLEQVVSNLLDNACKYTPAGGAVEIVVRAEGDAAVLTIRDSGSGIAPDVLPKIFDLFSQGARTLDRSQGGLGLGLTVVRRLIDLHGGTIAANSDGLDRGATFCVRLPLTSAPIEASAQSAQAATAPLSIVVVEDNTDNRQLVGEILRMHGHRVVEAEDGISGVAAILDDGVDLAIVDIGLPGWDGYEVARRVRAAPAGARLRLVALTGYGRDEDKALAREAGFDLFLVKPFDIEKFLAALAQLQGSAASGPPSA
jgi:signal transduction histidine kinase/ActR/RegA family two-component response regulator